MDLVHGIAVGMFALILVYLGVKNQKGVVAIFNATGQNVSSITRTLQGR